MATAAVAKPQSLASQLATAIDQGPRFIIQDKVSVPDEEDGMPEDLLRDKFILNDQCFVDLQIYLKSAMKLPESKDRFEKVFPPGWFKEYFDADKENPTLYVDMRDGLVGVSEHCSAFWTNTMGPMVTLAGRIANFCDEAKEHGDDLYKQLLVITKEGVTVDDPSVGKAIQRASKILKDLKKEAERSSQACEKYVTQLSAFQTVTEQDKNKVDKIATKTVAHLPSNDKLNADLRQKMKEATKKMTEALEKVRENEQKKKDNSGVKWYYFIAWPLTLGTALHHDKQKKDAVQAIKDADKEYQDVLKAAGQQMSAIIGLRANCKSLQTMITNVQQAIAKAQNSLEHIKGAFSQLQTDIEYITNRLEKIDDSIIDADEYEREKSLRNFDNARWRWVLVKNLARGFQQKGLLVEANLHEEEPPEKAEDHLEVCGATYGDDVVTSAAKVLFNDGEDMLIDTTSIPLPVKWPGYEKTLSIFFTYGQERRLFVAADKTGEHKIKRGAIALSQDKNSLQMVITPRPKPSGALYQILAIVWGKQQITDDSSYKYVYEQMNGRKKVKWDNKNFHDGWVGKSKTGAIYYTTDGKDVKIIVGWEGGETGF